MSKRRQNHSDDDESRLNETDGGWSAGEEAGEEGAQEQQNEQEYDDYDDYDQESDGHGDLDDEEYEEERSVSIKLPQ